MIWSSGTLHLLQCSVPSPSHLDKEVGCVHSRLLEEEGEGRSMNAIVYKESWATGNIRLYLAHVLRVNEFGLEVGNHISGWTNKDYSSRFRIHVHVHKIHTLLYP
jgi:hypothetical protein